MGGRLGGGLDGDEPSNRNHATLPPSRIIMFSCLSEKIMSCLFLG